MKKVGSGCRLLGLVVFVLLLSACGDAGPEADFDVTGVWVEQGGGSTLEFTEEGGYAFVFDPALSDGTTKFSSESFDRIDNAHVGFTIIMGRGSIEIIDIKASISSDHVLKFKLDGKTYRFEKAG